MYKTGEKCSECGRCDERTGLCTRRNHRQNRDCRVKLVPDKKKSPSRITHRSCGSKKKRWHEVGMATYTSSHALYFLFREPTFSRSRRRCKKQSRFCITFAVIRVINWRMIISEICFEIVAGGSPSDYDSDSSPTNNLLRSRLGINCFIKKNRRSSNSHRPLVEEA